MPQQHKTLPPKPGKEQLFIKQGTKPENIGSALKDMKGGESRTGFLGSGNILRKPDYEPEPENLDAESVARKGLIQTLLTRWITPNELSAKSTPERDRKSLTTKLKKSSLAELNQMLPESVKSLSNEQLYKLINGEEDITEDEKTEVQSLYMDVSP